MSDSDLLTVSNMMDAKVKPVKAEIQRLRLEMENDYRPRLNTIEETYTDTYKRYESEIENMEHMKLDIGVIKSFIMFQSKDISSIKGTLKEHDERLGHIENILKEHDERFDRIEDTLQIITGQMQNLTCMVERLS